MSGTFRYLPPPGSLFWQDAVASVGALPASGDASGEVINVIGTGLYYWDGSAWQVVPSSGGVPTSRNINTTAPLQGGGNLSADRTLSITQSGNATDGYLSSTDWNTFNNKVSTTRAINTTSPITGGGNLSSDRTIAIPAATNAVNGYLTSADWTTFNSKEPAIASGTTSQYWRGDKSFQTLNSAALLAVTDGSSSASSGLLGEVISAVQTTNTTTGIGASTAWGSPTSISLTAGAWIVQGIAGFNANGANLTDGFQVGISASSTGAGIVEFDTQLLPYLISTTQDPLICTPFVAVDITSTTTYYLNTRFWYTSGTPKHRGKIIARRWR